MPPHRPENPIRNGQAIESPSEPVSELRDVMASELADVADDAPFNLFGYRVTMGELRAALRATAIDSASVPPTDRGVTEGAEPAKAAFMEGWRSGHSQGLACADYPGPTPCCPGQEADEWDASETRRFLEEVSHTSNESDPDSWAFNPPDAEGK